MEGKKQFVDKLRIIEKIVYSKESLYRLEQRIIKTEDIEKAFKVPENVLLIEEQNEGKYRIVFQKDKRYYLCLVVRFVDIKTLKIITTYIMSFKRMKRYEKWLQKKRL